MSHPFSNWNRPLLSAWLLWLTVVALTNPALAVTKPAAADVEPVKQVDLDSARQALKADTSLSDPQRQEAGDLLQQAVGDLEHYTEAHQALLKLQQQISSAPQQIKQLTERLHKLGVSPVSLPREAPLDQLQLLQNQQQTRLSSAQSALTGVQSTLATLRNGAKGIGDRIADLSRQLDQIETNLRAPVGDTPATLLQIQHLALRVRYQWHRVEQQSLQLELGNLELLTRLAQVRENLLEAGIGNAQDLLSGLGQAIQAQREQQARAAVKKAEVLQTRAADLPPAVQAIAAANARYRKELASLVAKGKDLDHRIAQLQQQAAGIDTEFDRTRQRVGAIGLTRAVGRMLRRRRAGLPSLPTLQRSSGDHTTAMNQATERQMTIEDLQQGLGNPQQSVARALQDLQDLPATISEKQRSGLRSQALELAQARQDALDALIDHYGQYIGKLAQLDLAQRQLGDQVRAFAGYIDKQLIWVPGSGLRPLLQADAWSGIVHWALGRAGWQALADDLRVLPRRRPVIASLMLVLLLVLMVSRRHAGRRLAAIARDTRRIRSDSFWLTLEALWITIALAAPLALAFVLPALVLVTQSSGHPFTESVAGAALNIGIMIAMLGLMRAICRKDGLGDRHLQWPLAVREAIRRESRWILPAILVPGLVIGATYRGNAPEAAQALGQLAFIVLMGVIMVAIMRLLGAKSPITRYLHDYLPGSWMMQSHFLWYRLLLLIPLALAVTALSNYYFAALEFAVRLRLTIWLVFGLLLVRDLLLRWFYIAERRLRLADALARREEMLARREAGDTGEGEDGPQALVDDQQLDYSELSEQSRRLVSATFVFGALFGVWSIWVDLLPLLGFLNQVALPFDAVHVVDGVSKQTPVTLANLLMALFLLLVTTMAARNLPGLLEIVLLRRLPLTPGSRFAITSLSQYLIVGIGVFTAFAFIGLQWSKVQWLVAALGVGVGFGLQEIVANFISGVILLFEQPIRVGDVVTVDDTTGTVTRLRIRATTITNWDRQELLVPNKQFITGKVLNWTLSSEVNRSIITVGIAYGADVARAMKLLTGVAREHPDVLDDPAPFASFEEFGDSALTLRLRVYMATLDRRLGITSELYQGIYERFDEAGIVIAFPQLDVHLDQGGAIRQ